MTTPTDLCNCLAAEYDRAHTREEHTNCGLSNQGGSACGDCDSCREAWLAFHTGWKRREEAA